MVSEIAPDQNQAQELWQDTGFIYLYGVDVCAAKARKIGDRHLT